MEPKPICKLCRHRHESGEPHVFLTEPLLDGGKGVVSRLADPAALPQPPAGPQRARHPGRKPGRPNNPEWQGEDGYFERNKYQRVYMRKWRKQHREGKVNNAV